MATHFRAYGEGVALSRRILGGKQQNVKHRVDVVLAEGKLEDGVAKVPDGTNYVVFYEGKGDEATVVGRLDGPFKGGKADLADVEVEDQVPESFVENGQTYETYDENNA